MTLASLEAIRIESSRLSVGLLQVIVDRIPRQRSRSHLKPIYVECDETPRRSWLW